MRSSTRLLLLVCAAALVFIGCDTGGTPRTVSMQVEPFGDFPADSTYVIWSVIENPEQGDVLNREPLPWSTTIEAESGETLFVTAGSTDEEGFVGMRVDVSVDGRVIEEESADGSQTEPGSPLTNEITLEADL